MKNIIRIISILLISTIIFTTSCKKLELNNINNRQCSLTGLGIHPKSADYQKIIDKYIAAGDVGLSITVISPEGIWSKAAGMSDLKNKIAMQPCDLLRIASISKVYTATAIMKLYEEGKINLDDKISEYISTNIIENIVNGDKITVKQLLNHTSGIRNYVYETSNSWTNNSIQKLSAEENLKFIYNKAPNFEPGEKFEYSNSNYLLLGIIIKNISEASSAYEAINELIIKPLGLENTFLTTSNILNSNGYRDLYDKGVMKDFSYIDENAVGGKDMTDGGIISNSYDVALFFHALMNGEIVADSTLNMMETFVEPKYPASNEYVAYTGYGLGLTRIKTGNKTAIGHFGMVNCFNSLVYHFEEENITICVLNNAYSHEIEKVHMGNTIYEHLFE